MRNFYKDQSGVAIVEATLVFPIVFFILVFLMMISFYLYQKVAVDSDVRRAAVMISHAKAFPDGMNSPYRYWTSNIDGISTMQLELDRLLETNQFFFSSNFTSKIACQNDSLSQQIIVHTNNQSQFPSFFQLIGLEKFFQTDVYTIAAVHDPAEFIRNVDIAFDFVHDLSEQYSEITELSRAVRAVID